MLVVPRPLNLPCPGGRVSGYDALLLAGSTADARQFCSVDRSGRPCARELASMPSCLCAGTLRPVPTRAVPTRTFAAVLQDVHLEAINVGSGAPVRQAEGVVMMPSSCWCWCQVRTPASLSLAMVAAYAYALRPATAYGTGGGVRPSGATLLAQVDCNLPCNC